MIHLGPEKKRVFPVGKSCLSGKEGRRSPKFSSQRSVEGRFGESQPLLAADTVVCCVDKELETYFSRASHLRTSKDFSNLVICPCRSATVKHTVTVMSHFSDLFDLFLLRLSCVRDPVTMDHLALGWEASFYWFIERQQQGGSLSCSQETDKSEH